MRHKIKTRIFKFLSLLPESVGYNLYHLLQNVASKITHEDKILSTKKSIEIIKRILNENNIILNNFKVAELGSGWLPVLPYEFVLSAGVNRVDTYDVNRFYKKKEIDKVNDYYSKYFSFDVEKKRGYNLLSAVHYYPNTKIYEGDLKHIDLIISRFVLEHIPKKEIEKMHIHFANNLKSGAYILHLISPSDHRAYTDKSLSLQDFLKYSENEWESIQTKFDYHNRLRLPQYLEILAKGFDLLYYEHDQVDQQSVEYFKFKKLNIHDDFLKYSDSELMAGSINVLLRKR